LPIQLDIHGRLARITLAQPPLNVLDLAHLEQLADAVARIGDASVAVVAAGPRCRAFSAGNAVQDHVPERAPAMLAAFHRVIAGLLATDAVTVADVRGDAFGGGCELVCACDLAVAHPGARFGQPEIDIGCFPPVAASVLPNRIGWARAVEMIATGRRDDAATALAWGLVNDVGEDGADALVATLLAKSPAVLRTAKAALGAARAGGIRAAERAYTDVLLPLPDCTEGVRAFLEKRPPRWAP
jgi:cyclohexa-1,5-dienecarbonyl-CoA hydratase